MSASVRAKICGVRRPEDVRAAAQGGAAYLGFVFFPKSPRSLTPAEAGVLSAHVPAGLCKVGLVVDAQDALLDEILSQAPLDMLQLHGRESPERVAEVRARYGLPVMKAVGVSEQADLARLACYSEVADQILVDAKPPRDAVLPGGNGLAFDWRLIAGRRWTVPWMLAGGLTPETVATAITMTGAVQVDVSSGVEASPGVKDSARIAAFLAAAGACAPGSHAEHTIT